MFIYSNNNNRKHSNKAVSHSKHNISNKKSIKVKTSSKSLSSSPPSKKKRLVIKKGKSLRKTNTEFLRALGFKVRKG